MTKTRQEVRSASASLADSTSTGTPATVATSFFLVQVFFIKDSRGGGITTAAARSGSAFTVDGQGEALDLAIHDRQDEGQAPALLVAAARARLIVRGKS